MLGGKTKNVFFFSSVLLSLSLPFSLPFSLPLLLFPPTFRQVYYYLLLPFVFILSFFFFPLSGSSFLTWESLLIVSFFSMLFVCWIQLAIPFVCISPRLLQLFIVSFPIPTVFLFLSFLFFSFLSIFLFHFA